MPIASIIKYEGDNSTFVWKHPSEDFNTASQLIVHESQEAIFFANGQALDLFGPGRYTLDTENIPILRRFLQLTTGGIAPFHCEVYFINKTVQMALKWGTDAKVRYIDPASGVPLELGASGTINLCVADSRKLVLKLVGTMSGIAWDTAESTAKGASNGFTKSLQNAFRPLISTAVKSHLTAAIKASNINLLEVDEHLEELSATLRDSILPGFEEYGLTIPQFYLTTVVLPEDDPNFRRIRELYTVGLQQRMASAEAQVRTAQAQAEAEITAARRQIELEKQTTQTEIARREAERKLIDAQAEAQAKKLSGFAEAEVMRAQGYSQMDVIQAEVQKAYAEGLGSMGSGSGGGSPMSDIIGLGVGLQAAGAMSGQIGNMFAGFNPGQPSAGAASAPATGLVCAKCGAALPDGTKFCLECGEKVAPPVPDGMAVCPSCGKTVVKGKFCPECGFKFATACPKCGKEVPEGAKFCLECGGKL